MYHRLNCLILRSDIVAEADKAITVYTKEWGKISALVPGAKKIKAKLNVATEPVMESELQVYRNSPAARPKVTGAVIQNNFSDLRNDWRKLRHRPVLF